jgi:hypothetical protein
LKATITIFLFHDTKIKWQKERIQTKEFLKDQRALDFVEPISKTDYRG